MMKYVNIRPFNFVVKEVMFLYSDIRQSLLILVPLYAVLGCIKG